MFFDESGCEGLQGCCCVFQVQCLQKIIAGLQPLCFHSRLEKRFLGIEIAVYRLFGDAGLLGDLIHTGTDEAAGLK